MMGCEGGVLSPIHDELEELDLNLGMKKRHRRSFGGKTIICLVKTNSSGVTTLEIFGDITQTCPFKIQHCITLLVNE